MRVLLINTNRVRPPVAPLALDYLGASLRGEGHDLSLLDLCWEEDAPRAISRAFSRERIDVAAVSFRNTDDCYFLSRHSFAPQLRQDLLALRASFDGPVILGGAGFSLAAVPLLEETGEAYGIRGDGETALPSFLRFLQGRMEPSDVPGLVYREKTGWVRNPSARAEPARLTLSSRDVVDNRRYFVHGGQIGIETKRGCPGRCIYCADPVIKGHHVRTRPVGDLVAEIRNLLSLGIDHFHLCDSEFNLPEEHAAGFCRGIVDAGLGERIRWYAYLCPVPFSRGLARLMRKAGCAGVNFGADSGSDRMLAALGRTFRTADIRDCAAACRETGIPVMLDLLLGAPGETWETVAETIRNMKEIAPDCIGVSYGVRIYPGTPLAARIAGPCEGPEEPVETTPAYYVSPSLTGNDPLDRLRSLIGKDERFFLPCGEAEETYNYNENRILEDAIERGARGAYWKILLELRTGT